jgi:isocitrate/isopropylmalate dehydrogenase
MARDDAYGAKEWRETADGDEVAYRTERISRSVCRAVSRYAFIHAASVGARVFGGPKFTVSPVYEGMFKEEMDAAAAEHPQVVYEPQLIDATFALLLATSGDPLVIPSLNRDGDLLSDMVLQMFGSIAGSESMVISLDGDGAVSRVMAEAPHGTAPTLQGKNVANPMAMILAAAGMLGQIDAADARRASRAVYEATLEAVFEGHRTADLGGTATTSAFTDEVIRRARSKLEVWRTMG